jgi:tRNA pseudouridine38-40 synthase
MMWRAAVKIAYDGRMFMGSQRQPDEYTVEGEVIRSLGKIGAIPSTTQSRFKSASRTDRGVSALGNVVAFDTCFEEKQLIQALNAVSKDVHFYALARVPQNFSPRRARGRWYRYFLPSTGLEKELVSEAATAFEGKHDFKRFCKNDDRITTRTLEEVKVLPLGKYLVIDIRAREFLRNMIRRMVAAMESVGKGEATIAELKRALEGEDISFGLAPPENLCLMDIFYAFDFDAMCPPTLLRKLGDAEEKAFLNLDFHRALLERCLSRQAPNWLFPPGNYHI